MGIHRIGRAHAQRIVRRNAACGGRSPTAFCILDGLPNYQRLFSLRVGQTLREQFEADLAIEYEVVARLKPGIIMCREKEDATSANLFEKILADEEDHIDYLETQLS